MRAWLNRWDRVGNELKILETINPWKRQENHDQFFGALEKAGVFDEQDNSEDIPRLSLVR